MSSELDQARDHFIQGLSRITFFWGFPKAMGAIFGVIFLSPAPVSLNSIVDQVGITKGAVSTNVRSLERLGMIHKHLIIGDRKDYYTAETDFWKIAKGILREREKNEFDIALKAVGESLALVNNASENDEKTAFYNERLTSMKEFFDALDKMVSFLVSLDNAQIQSMGKMFFTEGG